MVPISTTRFAIGKLAFEPKYSVHGSKVSNNLEGGGKKGKDGSFVFTYGSQQPLKKPWANKLT